MDKQQELKKECEKLNEESESYKKTHYGNNSGPRRQYHWEVIGGQKTLVEE